MQCHSFFDVFGKLCLWSWVKKRRLLYASNMDCKTMEKSTTGSFVMWSMWHLILKMFIFHHRVRNLHPWNSEFSINYLFLLDIFTFIVTLLSQNLTSKDPDVNWSLLFFFFFCLTQELLLLIFFWFAIHIISVLQSWCTSGKHHNDSPSENLVKRK